MVTDIAVDPDRFRQSPASRVKDCQVERCETLRTGGGVDGEDSAVVDGELEHHGQAAERRDDDADGAVDEGRLSGPCAAGGGHFAASGGAGGVLLRAANLPSGHAVGAQNDVWIEESQQALEVADPRGGQKGVDHFSLATKLGGGDAR